MRVYYGIFRRLFLALRDPDAVDHTAATLSRLRPSTLRRNCAKLSGDTLSSVLRSAVRYGFLVKNPLDGLQMPPDKRGRRSKSFITPAQFDALLQLISEPYATMLYTAVWTGLRVSELIGLKWRCI